MAKTRSRSRKKSVTRAKPARRARTARARAPKPKQIELRPIRTKLKAHVNALGAAIGTSPGANPQMEEALKRMSRWLDDIQDICGPDMMIPLP